MNATSRIAPWLTTLVLLGACATPRVPPHSESSQFGVVHASDAATARQYAGLLDDVAPVVARALPGLVVEPVDLRVVGGISDIYRSSTHGAFAGATFETGKGKWIEIRSDLEPDPRRAVMAHELVHRWLGPAWKALPPAFEDGLADVIGDAVRGKETPHERMRSFVACWLTLNGQLTVDQNAAPVDSKSAAPFAITFHADIERLEPAMILDVVSRDLLGYHSVPDPRRFAVVTVLSRRVLSRISVDELFDLCRAAAEEGLDRVPAERIFAAAHIDPLDLGDWNALLLENYGAAEQRALKEEVEMPWKIGNPTGNEMEGLSIRLQASVEF